VSLAEDQHPVGDFGPDRRHEPFGEAVRPRTSRRDLEYFDTCVRHDRVEQRCELPGPVADEEPEPSDAVAEVQSILHDWQDEPAIEILRTCRRAARTGTALLVIERQFALPGTKLSDLNMLVGPGGRGRATTPAPSRPITPWTRATTGWSAPWTRSTTTVWAIREPIVPSRSARHLTS
jgi:hypothetical protein